MKVVNKGDITKITRKVSKLRSIMGITSAKIKEKTVFMKGTTKRRMKKLNKLRVIRNYLSQKKTVNT